MHARFNTNFQDVKQETGFLEFSSVSGRLCGQVTDNVLVTRVSATHWEIEAIERLAALCTQNGVIGTAQKMSFRATVKAK